MAGELSEDVVRKILAITEKASGGEWMYSPKLHTVATTTEDGESSVDIAELLGKNRHNDGFLVSAMRNYIVPLCEAWLESQHQQREAKSKADKALQDTHRMLLNVVKQRAALPEGGNERKLLRELGLLPLLKELGELAIGEWVIPIDEHKKYLAVGEVVARHRNDATGEVLYDIQWPSGKGSGWHESDLAVVPKPDRRS